MKNIEKFEELVDDLEKSIPTPEYIKEQANINVMSIKKYFPQAFRAKRITISGAYIIFTISKDRYIGSSRDILSQIGLYKTKNILVAYIYETDYIDAKHLELWLHKLLESDDYNILPKRIEDIVQKSYPKNASIENIIPKNISVTRCIDNMTIENIKNIPHMPGTYILQFTDGECYIGSSVDLRIRLMRHRSHLSNFISRISICETQDVIDASILEVIFIKILKPKYNRVPSLDNGNRQSINVPCKGRKYKNISFRRTNIQFITISKDISDLLEKKMIELFNKGIFSLSIQKLTECAIKKGLDIISDNISNEETSYQYRCQYQFQYQYRQYQQCDKYQYQHQYIPKS